MADKNLPPDWEAFQTIDGEWYYYNTTTEVAQFLQALREITESPD